jgi:serine/threonine protein phosphatase 1
MKFKLNKYGRDFIIGDLHGCIELLENKLKEIYFNKQFDRIFSVGDLIDRGSDSLACLQLVEEPWFFPVLGNHEDMMLNAIKDNNFSLWYLNGGDWYIYTNKAEVQRLLQVVKELPIAITVETEKGDIGICHAQPPSKYWAESSSTDKQSIAAMLWSRSWINYQINEQVQGVLKTYHGHTPVKEITTLSNVNFIDTGAVWSGKLTCIRIN